MGWIREYLHRSDEDDQPLAEIMSKDIVLLEPRVPDDALDAADQLLKGHIIAINLRKASGEPKQRIVDFINGVIYAIHGRITAAGSDLILCSPGKEDISGEIQLLKDTGR